MGETLCLFLPDLRVDGDYRSPPGCEYPLFNFPYKIRYATGAEQIENFGAFLKRGLFNGLIGCSELFIGGEDSVAKLSPQPPVNNSACSMNFLRFAKLTSGSILNWANRSFEVTNKTGQRSTLVNRFSPSNECPIPLTDSQKPSLCRHSGQHRRITISRPRIGPCGLPTEYCNLQPSVCL